MSTSPQDPRIELVYRYHDETKHHLHRYARSLGYLDWANQPDPFRRFHGAQRYPLPLKSADTSPPYDALFARDAIHPAPWRLASLAALLEHSLAISAWKELQGSRWALRCNPSSGNLHPTEGYLILGPLSGFSESPGVYHYAPDDHALELRHHVEPTAWSAFAASTSETVLIGLTSIHWREAWKYGERAFRYCQHDLGHAIAAVAIAAAALGWHARVWDSWSTEDVAGVLGLDPTETHPRESETAECVIAISTTVPITPPPFHINASVWHGQPNQLSSDHVHWEIIDKIAIATRKPATEYIPREPPPAPPHAGHNTTHSAWQIAFQRRSAVAMDGKTSITAGDFFTMLARTMPVDIPPWTAWPYPPNVHLALFVHRVDDLPPGLYMLLRDTREQTQESLIAACRKDFDWERIEQARVPLYRLLTGDCQRMAAQISCMQEIAGDGAFSLGMIARFNEPIQSSGAWMYPRLFWECGLIGQVLYLEAEAAGVRATGIGCFFDDAMHDVLGTCDRTFQSLYHFTVGGPVEDTRLTTHPPYGSRA